MTKQIKETRLKRLLGKKVCLNGKFAYGEREKLSTRASSQQGTLVDDIDSTVDFLVLADLSAGKTIQKKVASLNAKGASIQVIDVAAFDTMIEPSADEILELIRGGTANAKMFIDAIGTERRYRVGKRPPPFATYVGENFDGIDLSAFHFDRVHFDQCSFKGTVLSGTTFQSVERCDFSRATASSTTLFFGCEHSSFREAKLSQPRFSNNATGNDFTAAVFEEPSIAAHERVQKVAVGSVFAKSKMLRGRFHGLQYQAPDFDGGDFTGSQFTSCSFSDAQFRNAILLDSSMIDCVFPNADLTGANLKNANLSGTNLTDAKFARADLQDCNLRGANLSKADLSKAKNFHPQTTKSGNKGPALTELDALVANARRLKLSFKVRVGKDDDGEVVGIDSRHLRWGLGLQLPPSLSQSSMRRNANSNFSDSVMTLANLVGNRRLRYETLDIESSKLAKPTKELRELVMNGLAEAFDQPVPPAEELVAAIKIVKEQNKDQAAADKARREEAKLLAEKLKKSEKKQIARKIAKEVGQVTDIASFLKALELRADKSKIEKATKMLKAEKFKLFNDITDANLTGVIKSQTDPDLVYACRIESDGQYACCTQNLNICGGLRGSPCKHLLVLIIGLVKAGELDPTTIDGWVAKTHDTKPELNKETMGEIFIKYKGAEAGEVDWRPTETLPEDYYAL